MYQKLSLLTILLQGIIISSDQSVVLLHQDIVCHQIKFKASPIVEEDLEIMHKVKRAEAVALREARVYYGHKDLTHVEELKLFIELGGNVMNLSSEDIIVCKYNAELCELLQQKGFFIR